jgi:2-phosphoglycerate kinase
LNTSERKWDILLLGGASGVGKTCVSLELSKRTNVGIIEVDDFQTVLEAMTNENDYPVVHYWNKHFEDAIKQSDNKKMEIMVEYARIMSSVLELIIENHLENNRPAIIEGDFIAPQLGKLEKYGKVLSNKRVQSVYLLENDFEQINENYKIREGHYQNDRAKISLMYNNWIKNECIKNNVIYINVRPWETITDRILELI